MEVSEKHVSRAHEARAIRQPAANFRESKCAQGGRNHPSEEQKFGMLYSLRCRRANVEAPGL